MPFRPRNPVARSPLMRKGGTHQTSRSGERQQKKKLISCELDEWAKAENEEVEIKQHEEKADAK